MLLWVAPVRTVPGQGRMAGGGCCCSTRLVFPGAWTQLTVLSQPLRCFSLLLQGNRVGGPLTSWQRPYASIVEHSSTISIPIKDLQPDGECTLGCTAPCPTRCPPTSSCMEHEVALTTSSERHHPLLSL